MCPRGAGRGEGGAGGNEDGAPLLLLSLPSINEDEDDTAKEVCSLLLRTEIPNLVERLIALSSLSMVVWTQDSFKDVCLVAMRNMAMWWESLGVLRQAGVVRCLRRLERLPGIHGYRARAIRCSHGALLPLLFEHAVYSPL